MVKQLSYKELTEELARAMEDLEQGDLDIDEAVIAYERGLSIVRELEDHLSKAENKVIELKAAADPDDEEEE